MVIYFMYAKVELTNEVYNFINKLENHIESFVEIKELVFSNEMLKKKYTIADMLQYSIMFQEIKYSAFNKVKRKKKLNYPEGIVFERLMAKYTNTLIPFNDYLKTIKI